MKNETCDVLNDNIRFLRKECSILYLNKKQKKAIRKAIRKAIDIMSTILGNGLDSDEDGEIDFALEQLIKMTDSSYKQNNQERCWEE